jgi:cobalamin biosynthesis protein CobT
MFDDVAKKTKYMVYTKKYDRECRIGDLVDRETIERLDTHFEFHGYEDGASFPGLGEMDVGSIPDGARITILVDMSGSAQGRPIAQTCYGVLAATLALENAGASVEVLGYTTTGNDAPVKSFNGDRTITEPGRLSAVLHVVAKEDGTKGKTSPGSILAMATKGLGHENLDGEAIIWAANRLGAKPGTDKVLVLVTDFWEPMCRATERYNRDTKFLKAHLKAVVAELDERDELEFVPVVLSEPWSAEKQDTYTSPVTAKAEAADVAAAIGEALSRVLAQKVKVRETATPAL